MGSATVKSRNCRVRRAAPFSGRWIYTQTAGLQAVRHVPRRVPVKALAAHRMQLAAELKVRPPQTLAEARKRIAKLTNIRRSITQVREFLREELGLRCRKVAAIPIPPKRTAPEHAAIQAAFLKDGTGGAAFGRGAGRSARGLLC